MHFYIIYGNIIFSDLEFPQLVPAEPVSEAMADIVIRRGVMPEHMKRRESERKYEFGESVSWLINKTVSFLVEVGKCITYEPRKNANIGYLRTYLLGYGLSMLHMQRGEMVFHCAAVHCHGQAVLIAGESGSGKSTLTTKLLETGYLLMADDAALVKVEKGRVMAYPAFPYQKLCRDAALKKEYCLEDLLYIDEEKDKFMVPYTDAFSVEGKPVKRMLYLMVDSKITEPRLEEMAGINKFYCCVNNLFLRKLLQKERYGGMTGPKCLEIAAGISMYLVSRPAQTDTAEAVWQMVKGLLDIKEIESDEEM